MTLSALVLLLLAPTPPDLLAYLPFDGAVGVVLGQGGLRPLGELPATVPGLRGGAASLASDCRLEPGSVFPKAEGTFAVWLRAEWPADDRATHYLLSLYGDPSLPESWLHNRFALCEAGGRLGLTVYGAAAGEQLALEAEAGALRDGAWHHVACTWKGIGTGAVTLRLYLDGSLVAEQSAPALSMGAFGTTIDIGRDSDGSPDYAAALLDDLFLYSRALTPEEIAAGVRQVRGGVAPAAVEASAPRAVEGWARPDLPYRVALTLPAAETTRPRSLARAELATVLGQIAALREGRGLEPDTAVLVDASGARETALDCRTGMATWEEDAAEVGAPERALMLYVGGAPGYEYVAPLVVATPAEPLAAPPTADTPTSDYAWETYRDAWDFDEGDTEEIDRFGDRPELIRDARVEDGVLTARVSEDPYIIWGTMWGAEDAGRRTVRIDVTRTNLLTLRVRQSVEYATWRILGRTAGSDSLQQYEFGVRGTGWQTIAIDLRREARWTGTLSAFRIDPTEKVEAEIAIDWVRLTPSIRCAVGAVEALGEPSGAVARLELALADRSPVAGSEQTVTVRALDAAGAPVAGQPILVRLAEGSDGALQPTGAAFALPGGGVRGLTDNAGSLRVSLTAGARAAERSATLLAASEFPTVEAAPVEIASIAGPPHHYVVLSPRVTIVPETETPLAIEAHVADACGNRLPLAGRRLSWSVEDGMLEDAGAATDATGGASARFVPAMDRRWVYRIEVVDDQGLAGASGEVCVLPKGPRTEPVTLGPNGYFRMGAEPFVPLGGFYAVWIPHAAPPGTEEGLDFGPFTRATEEEIHHWFGHLRDQGVTAMRLMLRTHESAGCEALDAGGRVNPRLFARVLRMLDIARRYGLCFLLTLHDDYDKPVYCNERNLEAFSLPAFEGVDLAALPEFQRRFLVERDLVAPPERYTDPDAIACQDLYTREAVGYLRDNPALFGWELENEMVDCPASWVNHQLEVIRGVDPVTPICVSHGGGGLETADPLWWTTRTAIDFYTYHLYPLGTTTPDVDYGAGVDLLTRYGRMAGTCFLGESVGDEFSSFPAERLEDRRAMARDVIWLSLMNGNPGCFFWNARGHELAEFRLARAVTSRFDWTTWRRKRPSVALLVPHPLDSDKYYRTPEGRLDWGAMASACQTFLSYGADFDFATSSEGYAETHRPGEALLPPPDDRPFEPSRGYQLASLTREDARQGLLYLRCFAGVEPWEVGPGRSIYLRTRKPAPARVRLELPPARVTAHVWDLNTGEERTLEVAGTGTLELGTSDHDFAVLWEAGRCGSSRDLGCRRRRPRESLRLWGLPQGIGAVSGPARSAMARGRSSWARATTTSPCYGRRVGAAPPGTSAAGAAAHGRASVCGVFPRGLARSPGRRAAPWHGDRGNPPRVVRRGTLRRVWAEPTVVGAGVGGAHGRGLWLQQGEVSERGLQDVGRGQRPAGDAAGEERVALEPEVARVERGHLEREALEAERAGEAERAALPEDLSRFGGEREPRGGLSIPTGEQLVGGALGEPRDGDGRHGHAILGPGETVGADGAGWEIAIAVRAAEGHPETALARSREPDADRAVVVGPADVDREPEARGAAGARGERYGASVDLSVHLRRLAFGAVEGEPGEVDRRRVRRDRLLEAPRGHGGLRGGAVRECGTPIGDDGVALAGKQRRALRRRERPAGPQARDGLLRTIGQAEAHPLRREPAEVAEPPITEKQGRAEEVVVDRAIEGLREVGRDLGEDPDPGAVRHLGADVADLAPQLVLGRNPSLADPEHGQRAVGKALLDERLQTAHEIRVGAEVASVQLDEHEVRLPEDPAHRFGPDGHAVRREEEPRVLGAELQERLAGRSVVVGWGPGAPELVEHEAIDLVGRLVPLLQPLLRALVVVQRAGAPAERQHTAVAPALDRLGLRRVDQHRGDVALRGRRAPAVDVQRPLDREHLDGRKVNRVDAGGDPVRPRRERGPRRQSALRDQARRRALATERLDGEDDLRCGVEGLVGANAERARAADERERALDAEVLRPGRCCEETQAEQNRRPPSARHASRLLPPSPSARFERDARDSCPWRRGCRPGRMCYGTGERSVAMRLPGPGEAPWIRCGAIGTNLHTTGAGASLPVEHLNLSAPERVLGLYRRYREAGARILVTNTFAAHRVGLVDHGLESRAEDLCTAGVRLAREASDGACAVWGCVGPLALGYGGEDYTDGDLAAIYREQCAGLREADALVLETFVEPREARAALAAAAETGLPVLFQVGRLAAGPARGRRMARLVAEAEAAGAVAIGANCQHPSEIQQTLRELARLTDLPLVAAPNAGHAQVDRGRVVFEFPPEQFAQVAGRLVGMGASVIGGCCGTTPEHIAALCAAHPAWSVGDREAADREAPAPARAPDPVHRRRNPVRALLREERPLIAVEIRADRGRSLPEIAAGAREVVAAGADLLDVPDNPAATVGRDAAVVAQALQSSLHVPAIPHLAVTQSNVLRLHSSLIGAWDLGLRGVLALTGDSPSIGPFAEIAKRATDVKSSVELLRLIASLREGLLLNGDAVADPPDLCAGCVTRGGDSQLRWLERKIAAGAEFVFTQPVFGEEAFRALWSELRPLPIRVFIGVLPLTSHRMAERLSSGRIPGIEVPEEVVRELERAGDREAQRQVGLARAGELARMIAREVGGLYLIMPFGPACYAETASVVSQVREGP